MNENKMPLVLIVEDDQLLSLGNCRALEPEGYEVLTAYTLAQAREQLSCSDPDVILLDVKLPDGSGFDFCREIRETTGAYIIFLTSVTEPSGELEGLRAGGNDYLRKPYGIEFLRERVKNAVRHRRDIPTKTLIKGNLTSDIVASQAFVDGTDLLLKPKEFALLRLLMQNENQTLSAEYLYEQAWKAPIGGDDRTLRKHISELRNKMNGENCEYTVSAVYGKGYCFEKR
jgi:DNA-binding response OmpR family regulator